MLWKSKFTGSHPFFVVASNWTELSEPEGPGGTCIMGFGKVVNPITTVGKIMPTKLLCAPRILRFSYGPANRTELWPQLMHPGLWLLKLQKWKWTWALAGDLGHNLFCCKGMCIVQKKSPCPGLYTLLTYTSQFLPPLNQFLAPHVSVPTLLFNMVYKKISCMCDLVCLLLLEQSFSLILWPFWQ